MSETFAWSTDIDGDVVSILEAIVAASDASQTVVFDGRAAPGALPPFITCWHLAPQRTGEGLAGEAWGIAHQQWQISPHGATQAQARYLAEQVCEATWPAGWELVDIGPMVPDQTDKPDTWFFPLTFVYRGMTLPD